MASFSISKKLKTQKRLVFSSPDKKNESFFNEREEEASQEQRKKSGLHANPLNEKANPFNQISLAMPQRFNLSRCELKKHQICKDLEPSNNATHHIVDQVLGIHFQEEIIMEILIRLPVRSLLRFKCVSKGWKALISDPYFKMKHLNHAKNDHNSQKFLVYRIFFGRNYTDMHCSSLSSDELIEDEQKLDIPMNARCGSCKIHGCCDGLVLIRIVGIERDMHFFLWNPSTRESIELPLPKHLKERLLYGIGYDMIDDDYKILALGVRPLARIEHYQGVSSEVLALKSGSWRDSKYPYPTGIGRVRGFIGCGMNSLAVVHGAFHWVGMSGDGDYTVVSFNISSEVYGEMPLLEGMCFKETERSRLNEVTEHGVSVLGGMLYFYATKNDISNNYEGEGSFKLWVMKEYGVKESWTILFTIRETNLFRSARPRYRYADGEVLLRCLYMKGGPAYVYKTLKGQFGIWPRDSIYRDEIVYTESLITPKLITTPTL